jgi:uncharacterized repeat protein (TIGR01451 family)
MLSDAANPANNFFNSSLSAGGVTYTGTRPNYLNQMGFDADVFSATDYLQNNQTSTVLRLATSGDGFAPFGVTFATDLFAPSLRIEKTVDKADAEPGDVLTYTIDVANVGQDAATNAILDDRIPAGTTYVPGTLRVLAGANAGQKSDATDGDVAEFDEQKNAVVFRLGTAANASAGGRLAINDTTRIQFKVRIASDELPSGYKVVNNAGVGFVSDTLNESGHVTSRDVVTALHIPDVTIRKHHTGGFVSGIRVPFTLAISNVGDAPTSGPVKVTDALPDELSFASQPTGTGWDCSATTGRTLSCVRDEPLARGASYPEITFDARVADDAPDGELQNTAKVTASPDGDRTNNIDTDAGTNNHPLIDMAIEKFAFTPVVFPGETVEFLLRVRNLGPDTATRVNVRDALPDGLTAVSLDPSRGTCKGTTCRLGTMDADTEATIDVKAVAANDTGGQQLRDVAHVSAHESEGTLANNESDATVEVTPVVDLAITKTTPSPTVPAGDDVSYTVVVTNKGPSAATHVELGETPPDGLQLVSATPLHGYCTGLSCHLGTLEAGASTQIVLVAHSDPSLAGSSLTNLVATIAHEPDIDLSNNLARSTVGFTAPDPQPQADVVVSKAASTGRVNVGGELTYRITATNRGGGTASSVIVTDTPDPGLAVVDVSADHGTCTSAVPISCRVGPLAPGTSTSIVIRARALTSGSLPNAVTAIPATTPGGHRSVADLRALAPPRVTLRKRANRTTVRPGATVDFTMTATAHGTGTARDIEICDRLPRGLVIVSRGGARLHDGRTCWTIASLAAGRSRALHLRVRAAGASRRITNTATLAFGNQPPLAARARVRVLPAQASFTG